MLNFFAIFKITRVSFFGRQYSNVVMVTNIEQTQTTKNNTLAAFARPRS